MFILELPVHCVEDEAARKDSRYHLKSVNAETRGILDELDRTYSAPVCAFVVATRKFVVDIQQVLNYLHSLRCLNYCC